MRVFSAGEDIKLWKLKWWAGSGRWSQGLLT
jgi:hypothetical protein